jgi:DnaJ-domain-containing protein 1
VSITRRILDSAQSGLSRLTSMVIVDDEPLSNVESAMLASELAARRAAREANPGGADQNPLAVLAGTSASARAERARLAEQRVGKVRREREQREAAHKRAADEAFARVRAQAAAGGGPSASAAAGASSSSSSSSSRPPRPGSSEAQLAEHYRTLDLPMGADLAQVKTAYRKMMRKYHPDMHAGSPQKQKAATELSMKVTGAYNALTTHLEKKG